MRSPLVPRLLMRTLHHGRKVNECYKAAIYERVYNVLCLYGNTLAVHTILFIAFIIYMKAPRENSF
jgi:hypothetical protein